MYEYSCLHDHLTDCTLEELWNLTATNATFMPDVSLLDAATKYQNCGTGSVGSAALKDTRLNITTVAYYNGITPGSKACFVCDENSGYEHSTATYQRVCKHDATWSRRPIICGTLCAFRFCKHRLFSVLSYQCSEFKFSLHPKMLTEPRI